MHSPKIRFKEFNDKWNDTLFGTFIEKIKEKNVQNLPLQSYSISNKVGFYPQTEMFNGGYAVYADKKNSIIVPTGSFAYNPARINIGSIGYQNVGKDVLVSPMYEVFKTSENIDHKFLWYRFKTFSFSHIIFLNQEGGVRLCFNYDKLAESTIKLPSKEEQKKVGRMLQYITNLINKQQLKVDKIKQLKETMLKKMFPEDGTNIPEIRFKGFQEKRIEKELGSFITDVVDNRGKNPPYYTTSGIPVIDNFMVKNDLYPDLSQATRFIDENLFKGFIRKYNQYDDILITLVGNGIGNVTLFPNKKSVIIQNTIGLRVIGDKKFLFYQLQSKHRNLLLLDRGMAQPSIRQDELKSMMIYQTNNNIEQQKIGLFFKSLDNLIDKQQLKLDKLQQIKQTLLQKMFI